MRSATSPRRSRFSGSSTSRSPPQSCCSGFTSGRLAWTWATRNVDASWRSSRPEVPLRASSLDSCSSKRHSGERSLRSWASLREWALSRLLLTFVSPFSTPTAPRYEVIVLTPSTIVIVTILSVIFMAITSIRSARRTARIPIVETLRYYAPGETRIQYRPWVDILLITLAIVTYGMVLYARTNPQDFFTFLIGALFFIILPFTPIFLIVGTTRLLTRSTGRVYEWTARVCKPFAKNLYYVISRNLRRNPRRSANVAVIIALGLATPGQVLVTEAYLRNAFLAVGDRLRFEGSVYNGTNYTGTVTVNTTIGGTVRGLPGTGYLGFGLPNAIYGSPDTMGPLIAPRPFPSYGGDRYLVAFRANGDWHAAKAGVVALGGSNVQVTAEQIEGLRSNPVFRAFFGFIELEMAFMIVILTAGPGVIFHAATRVRAVGQAASSARDT